MILETKPEAGLTFIKATNACGFSVTLCDYGAGIYEMRLHDFPLTIADADKNSWAHSPGNYGKTLGRVAGRIGGGVLHYLGKKYPLSVNEGKNTLHGGKNGFALVAFRMDVLHLGDGVAVDFYHHSPALDMGFPGEVDVRVRYFISEKEPRLRITYEMTASEQTPLNLTNHTYFNLGGEKTVEAQCLMIKSHRVETYAPDLLPLGFTEAPRCLNFSRPKPIGQDILDPYLHAVRTAGYDHCFLFDTPVTQPVLTLESERFILSLSTDYPAVQIYSDNYVSPEKKLSDGNFEVAHAGVAIEPVYAPNDFLSMTVLPFEKKKRTIEYVFQDKEEK